MDWPEYCKKIYEECKQKIIPFHACFELTPFCNFNCNMCYVHLTPQQAKKQGQLLNTQQWLQIAEEAKKMGTLTLELTGGEAITRDDFCILYEAFMKMGYLIHLRTNGYLIEGKILALLKKYKPRKLSVTLYGASDETYQKVCGISDGFSVVTRNILAMKDANLNIRLTMTVTNDNVKDMNALFKWAKENDLSITPYGALISPIRGAERSIKGLQIELPEEEFIISDELQQSSHYQLSDRSFFMNPFWMCRGFGAIFSISWDGRMTLCNTATKVWKEPLLIGVKEAYRSLYEDLKKLKRPKECNDCQYIEFCSACPSRLQSATGDSGHTCENICKYARRQYKNYLLNQYDHDSLLDAQCEEGNDRNND